MACKHIYKGITYNSREEFIDQVIKPNTKTRRILEVQSDLFQKGRDKENLVLKEENKYNANEEDGDIHPLLNNDELEDFDANEFLYKDPSDEIIGTRNWGYGEVKEDSNNYYFESGDSKYSKISKEQYEREKIRYSNLEKEHLKNIRKEAKELKQNKFLQLLNKDNNWINFFIKSIIQDSAKKGYEKVLFPSGNTASKVEGHTTLEDFKKQKEDRIKSLEKENKILISNDDEAQKYLYFEAALGSGMPSDENSFVSQDKEKLIKSNNNEINQLKEELKRVETEGFGALKPIYNFYENTVTNILNKLGEVNVITDEYGNTWNEVTPKNLDIQLSKRKAEDDTINIQKTNLESLKSGKKTISIRKEGEHNYKPGDTLKVSIKGKNTGIKVKVDSITNIKDFSKISDDKKDDFARAIGDYKDYNDFKSSDDYAKIDSPLSIQFPDVYKFITDKIPADIIKYEKTTDTSDINESAYKKQYIYFTRRIKSLEKEQDRFKEGSDKYNSLQSEINDLQSNLDKINSTNENEVFNKLGRDEINSIEGYIKDLEEGIRTENKDRNIKYSLEALDAFKDFPELAGDALKLEKRLYPFTFNLGSKSINSVKTEKFEITKDMIDAQDKDISSIKEMTGTLRGVDNYIARTAGILVGNAQNYASSKRKHLKDQIEVELNKLSDWSKKNGTNLDKTWKLLSQEHRGTLVLTKPTLENGTINPNYIKIQNTPELKRFYDYYQSKIMEYQNEFPFKPGKYFIPNIKKGTIKNFLKSIVPVKYKQEGGFVGTEGLYADILPTKFIKKISSEEKSNNLADALLEFGHHSNEYKAFSKVLPEIRVLQEMIKYKINSKGEVIPREFIKDNDPSKKVIGENSNLNSMIDKWVNIQLKGEKKIDAFKIKIGELLDNEGNIIGEKYIHGSDIADAGLKANSLVKIGFAPVSIVSNISFGQISNIIEATGGKFFNLRHLHLANKTFFAQTFIKDSELNKLLEKFNLLKEQDDYESPKNPELKNKISVEKFQEIAYVGQKLGEKWNQATTVLAVMIKEGYFKNGKLTDKWNNSTEQEKTELVNKTQRINSMTHGRYSQQEAATASQKVWYRAVTQFRKWAIAMAEARFGKAQYDVDLGTDIEGRYRTFSRLLFTKDILNNLSKMAKGELTDTEKYNMKKNLTEVVLFLGTMFFAGSMGADKDKKKNPYWKLGLTLANRAAGDLDFFYSPNQIINLGANTVPLAKFAGDIIKTIDYIPYAFNYDVGLFPPSFHQDKKKSNYISGINKGKNKELVSIIKTIPGLNALLQAENIVNKNSVSFK